MTSKVIPPEPTLSEASSAYEEVLRMLEESQAGLSPSELSTFSRGKLEESVRMLALNAAVQSAVTVPSVALEAGKRSSENSKIAISSAGIYGLMNYLIARQAAMEPTRLLAGGLGQKDRMFQTAGEARALSDPGFRLAIQQSSALFDARLACFFKVEDDDMSEESLLTSFLESQVHGWNDLNWFDGIDALRLLGRNTVSLYRLSSSSRVHYTVIGGKYLFLQSIHAHGSGNDDDKLTWLIVDENLAGLAESAALRQLDDADFVPTTALNRWISELHQDRVLRILRDEDPNSSLSDLDAPLRTILSSLRFVDSNCTMTPLGSSWLSAVSE